MKRKSRSTRSAINSATRRAMYIIVAFLVMRQLWIQNGNIDIRQNKTLKQQEAIVNDILEKMNEVSQLLNSNLQKYASQLTAASQLVDALRADYETLGVPMEDALKDPENNLVEERFQVLKNRLLQTQACIVRATY